MGIALEWTQVVAVLILVLFAALIWTNWRQRRITPKLAPHASQIDQTQNALVFYFGRDGAFASANAPGDQFLRDIDLEIADWAQFRTEFLARFPDLPARVYATDQAQITCFDAVSPADPAQVTLETHPEGSTACVFPIRNGELAITGDAHCVFSQLSDLPVLRAVYDMAPNPVWVSMPDGRVIWSNMAFKTLDMEFPKNALDPGAPLFQLPEKRQTGCPDRISIRDAESGRTRWFNVVGKRYADGMLNFAYDIQDAIKAEAAQHNFVQTLAKTFAHLSTGLAVFDRNRQLVLFNPALVDLTHLPADFLIGRPTVFSFFDQLRNSQIMPEPKDYASWRERIADVISEASDGRFIETWAVSFGQTYRVTGRPHPDGAIAFLIEDISAEVSLTRKFRGEMAVTQSALNALPTSLAVFAANGAMVQCNTAMMREWGLPDASGDVPLDIKDVSRAWQKYCRPSPVWGEVRDFILDGRERAEWTGEARLKSGTPVNVQVSPIASGASLVALELQKSVQTKPASRKRRTAAA